MKKKLQSLILLILFIPLLACGEGTTVFPVLKFPFGARGSGAGEALGGVKGDLEALGYNPAGLSYLKRQEVLFGTLIKNFAGSKYTYLAYGLPVKKWGNFGFGLRVLTTDTTLLTPGEEEKETNKNKEVRAQQDMVITAGYSKEWRGVKLGVNFSLLRSTLIKEVSGFTSTLDAGVLYPFPRVKGLIFGCALQHLVVKPIAVNPKGGIRVLVIGERFDYSDTLVPDPLPLTFTLGASWCANFARVFTQTLAGVLNKALGSDFKLFLGGETLYRKVFAIRYGWKFGCSLKGFTFGIGLNYRGYKLDYAYEMFSRKEVKDDNHLLSFGLEF
jgi:hypothetical protein